MKKFNAYRVFIPEFQIYDIDFESQNPMEDGTLTQRRIFKTIYSTASIYSGFFPDFPVLISGRTKLPWTLGNLYLTRRLINNPNSYEADTFKSISGSLLDYLRFLESQDLDPLEFHERLKVRRPTYLYRQSLLDRMHAGELACSTGKQHMNRIIRFYRVLATDNIISSELLEKVHQARTVLIPIINSEGFKQSLSISTSDLAIKIRASNIDDDYIQDGGTLYPLTKTDQECLVKALKKSDRCIFLIFVFALFTGARIQTVGTLRIQNLKTAKLSPDGLYQVKVGPGTKVDTKNNKPFILLVPPRLRNALLTYIDSPTARKRRETSWYGMSDENYVFLNRSGDPYFTSKLERKERRNCLHHAKVGIKSSSKHIKPRAGEAIRTYIRETLLPRIKKENPNFQEFKFHDLRATFGMNLLELKLREMDEHNLKVKQEGRDDFRGTEWVLEQVMLRLGHNCITTTMRYLNFKRKLERREKILHEVEKDLMQYVPPSALETWSLPE